MTSEISPRPAFFLSKRPNVTSPDEDPGPGRTLPRRHVGRSGDLPTPFAFLSLPRRGILLFISRSLVGIRSKTVRVAPSSCGCGWLVAFDVFHFTSKWRWRRRRWRAHGTSAGRIEGSWRRSRRAGRPGKRRAIARLGGRRAVLPKKPTTAWWWEVGSLACARPRR